MNYHVRRHGVELGVFSPEELRQRRESGEFSGGEYVQLEGSADWQPLDLVLEKGYRTTPPPLPSSVSASNPPNPFLIWGIIVMVVVVFVVVMLVFVQSVRRGFVMASQQAQSRHLNVPRPEAVAAASKPVVWTTNSLKVADARKRDREFRLRAWLDDYEKHGQRNPACDAEVVQYLQVWIARYYGGDAATNPMSLAAEGERLAANPNCTDPLVMTVIGVESRNNSDAVHRLQRALDIFPRSNHQAYPQFYASVSLMGRLAEQGGSSTSLEAPALQQLQKCFTDGSFTPDDQQEAAEILVNGWGRSFFYRNGDAVCEIAEEAGTNYNWLALVLEGENDINKAWAARGSGYANSVTDAGSKKFREELASARGELTGAWNVHPNWPLAPCLMMTVALGDSGIDEMRVWFDRTTTAQIDYPEAWSSMRWGLRPRWYGNEAALLALGRTALNTGRFDTKVPEQFIDCVYDVESEMSLSSGKLFGRSDIWPDLQRTYEGYIRQTIPYPDHREWITAYAIAAYRAGKYDVSRKQLEVMNWMPAEKTLADWNLDATLWPLEIAARTGPLGKEINAAESLDENGNRAAAIKKYNQLESNSDADARTKEFVRRRLTALGQYPLITPQSYSMPPPSFTN